MLTPLTGLRTAFVTIADATSAVEIALRDGNVVSESDRIVEAAWLGPAIPGRLWRRILRGFGTTADAGLQLPFDAAGNDALGLLSPNSEFRPDGEALRAWRGTIRRPAPSDRSQADGGRSAVVVRDVWVVHPVDWRATEMREFELHGHDGRRVSVRCTKAPIVISVPTGTTVGEVEHALDPSTVATLRGRTRFHAEDAAVVVELRTEDVVDVLGIEFAPQWQDNPEARAPNYRAVAGTRVDVAGDLPEVRLVIRRVA